MAGRDQTLTGGEPGDETSAGDEPLRGAATDAAGLATGDDADRRSAQDALKDARQDARQEWPQEWSQDSRDSETADGPGEAAYGPNVVPLRPKRSDGALPADTLQGAGASFGSFSALDEPESASERPDVSSEARARGPERPSFADLSEATPTTLETALAGADPHDGRAEDESRAPDAPTLGDGLDDADGTAPSPAETEGDLREGGAAVSPSDPVSAVDAPVSPEAASEGDRTAETAGRASDDPQAARGEAAEPASAEPEPEPETEPGPEPQPEAEADAGVGDPL
ncbi:MAG: hypothetical protein AAFW46_12950, partial [Pseudomonadota bacterium]